MRQQLNWIQSAIGCYWNAGSLEDAWHIRTQVAVVNDHVIGLYKTLKAAQRAASKT